MPITKMRLSIKTILAATNATMLVAPICLWVLVFIIAHASDRIETRFKTINAESQLFGEIESKLLFHRNHLLKPGSMAMQKNANDLADVETSLLGLVDRLATSNANASEAKLKDAVIAYLARTREVRGDGVVTLEEYLTVQSYFDQVTEQLNAVSGRRIGQMTQTEEGFDKTTRRITIWSAALLGLLLLTGVAVPIVVSRLVYLPIRNLVKAVKLFGTGDFDQAAPAHGPQEIRELSSTFNQMAKSLQKQREGQMSFLAAIAHDLKNPITAIKLSSEMEMRKNTGSALIQSIHKQALHMNRLVNDLLEVGQIESGHLELKKEVIDIKPVLQEVTELYKNTSDKHVVKIEVPDEPVYLECDKTRLDQVLSNLLNNAIKYSPDGGEIKVAVSRRAGDVRILFSDPGIGVAPEDRESIFKPFQRSPATKNSSIAGIGLGLSTVRKILTAHGGSISVESKLGRGSNFVLQFPGLASVSTQAPLKEEGSAGHHGREVSG